MRGDIEELERRRTAEHREVEKKIILSSSSTDRLLLIIHSRSECILLMRRIQCFPQPDLMISQSLKLGRYFPQPAVVISVNKNKIGTITTPLLPKPQVVSSDGLELAPLLAS